MIMCAEQLLVILQDHAAVLIRATRMVPAAHQCAVQTTTSAAETTVTQWTRAQENVFVATSNCMMASL